MSVDLPFVNDVIETGIGIVTGTGDSSEPTQSTDLEGTFEKIVASALVGVNTDLEGNVTGIEFGSIGGGVYKTTQIVGTVGEAAEAVVNTLLAPLQLIGAIGRV